MIPRVKRLTFLAMAASTALVPAVPAGAGFGPGPNGPIAFSRTELVLLNRNINDDTAPNGNELSSGSLEDTTPSYSPDGTRIAWARRPLLALGLPGLPNTFGNSDIWVMNADGSGQHQLTSTTTANERNPTWSPDGTRIVYDQEGAGGKRQLWVSNSDGSATGGYPKPVFGASGTGKNDTQPAWKPDGTTLAFVRDSGLHALVVLGPKTTKIWTTPILPTGLASGVATQLSPQDSGGLGCSLLGALCATWFDDLKPDWHPTLDRLAFDRKSNLLANRAVLTMDVATPLSPTAVTTTGLVGLNDAVQPAYSPDGTKLAFAVRSLGGLLLDRVVTRDADATGPLTTVSQNLLLPNDQPTWGKLPPPPPVVPETRLVLLLPVGAGAVMLGAATRRGRRRTAPA